MVDLMLKLPSYNLEINYYLYELQNINTKIISQMCNNLAKSWGRQQSQYLKNYDMNLRLTF